MKISCLSAIAVESHVFLFLSLRWIFKGGISKLSQAFCDMLRKPRVSRDRKLTGKEFSVLCADTLVNVRTLTMLNNPNAANVVLHVETISLNIYEYSKLSQGSQISTNSLHPFCSLNAATGVSHCDSRFSKNGIES